MRKFTKEISALIATISVGTAAVAVSSASETIERSAGGAAASVETTAENIPLGGVTIPPDTTTTLIMGEIMPPDNTEPTTLPPTAGVPMPPDSTEPTTEEIPPLGGDVMPTDGDINADGEVSISDAVSLQKWLLGDKEQVPINWKAADLCEDDKLDVFDLCVLKQRIIDEGNQN